MDINCNVNMPREEANEVRPTPTTKKMKYEINHRGVKEREVTGW